ncbi:MAG: Gfo/Idh/MocA family oxidoreductase [Candidatus Sumerlaeia bacterium]|nr:Gfo/Idh/MocA family oxidoreductase [Candidatus Sumerlaeia bacterium]
MRNGKPTTRRGFLTSAAAASIAAPTILTSLTRRTAAAPANDRIVMGIIGPGKQGLALLKRFLRMEEVQMVAACDVSAARRNYAVRVINEHYTREKIKSAATGAKAYADFRELLAHPGLDAVIIATPDHWHAIMAIEACRQGKDVYCEKPLSLTIHEARQMMLAARKHNRVFQTGSMQRSEFDGRFRKACELVRSGFIGPIEKVLVCIAAKGYPEYSKPCDLETEPTPKDLDWDAWLGPAPLRGYNKTLCPDGIPETPPDDMKDHPFYTVFPHWRDYMEYSGGMMTDWGAHHFDIAQWGLGMDESGPVEIAPPEGDRPMTFKYANGIVMEKIADLEGTTGVKFIGAKGTVTVSRSWLKTDPKDLAEKNIPPENRLYFEEPEDHKRNFIDCVRSRKRPIADAEIGARSATVCHLGNLAYWNKTTIRWDPQKWEIVAPGEGTKWLDRPKRDPWKLPEV